MSSLIAHGAHEVAKYMPQGMQDAGTVNAIERLVGEALARPGAVDHGLDAARGVH